MSGIYTVECGDDEQGDDCASARRDGPSSGDAAPAEPEPRDPSLSGAAQPGDWIRKIVEDDEESAAVTQILCACFASLVQQVGPTIFPPAPVPGAMRAYCTGGLC